MMYNMDAPISQVPTTVAAILDISSIIQAVASEVNNDV